MQGGEHEVTGERGLNGDLRGFHEIARFTDHDAVGILTEEGAQGATFGEGEPDVFVDRHLDDPLDVVLHRVFRGEHLGIDGIDLVEGQRKGSIVLPEPVGPVTMKMPFGNSIVRQEVFVNVGGMPRTRKLEVDGTELVEHTKHDGLAELRGERGDTEIDRGSRRCVFWMRPSCGRRRSAMFRLLITFTREMTGRARCRGGGDIS